MVRIGASSYLNTAPLIWSFLHGSKRDQVEIVEGVPSECSRMLSEGTIDAALVPVIEYQRINGISLIPDVCVGSRREVRSVLLVSQRDALEEMRSIALDQSSRTSAALVTIIFREFVGFEPQFSTCKPEVDKMLAESDAALIIGDPAMTLSRTGLKVWDMAELWRSYTGLGFVFAMWMVRNEASELCKRVDFAGARDEGLAATEEIVSYYRSRIPLTEDELRTYLRENITFSIDDSMQTGLDRYFQLAHKHELIERLKPSIFLK